MKEKWLACRKALAADDELASVQIVPPQPSLQTRPLRRPRLFSRDATAAAVVEWEAGDADADEIVGARAAQHDKENNAGSSATPSSASASSTSTPTSASTLFSSTFLSSSHRLEATPSSIVRPTPSRITCTYASPKSSSSKVGGGHSGGSSSSMTKRKGTLSSRKLSSSELPSLAEAWKLSRRSLELEELELETAANWVGSKPQVLFQAGKRRGSIAEPSGALATASVSLATVSTPVSG